ncbi:ABC transporter permease [Streptomyces sp. NPDC001274]
MAAGENCLVANDWICGEYLRSRGQELTDATVQHVWITAVSVAIGLLVAFPLALLARRGRRFAAPVLGLTTVLYTVPSLALFSLLLPLFGLSAALVVTGLVLYSLTVLVRNILAGLEAVPPEAKEAARGMGYGPVRLLWEVELPLAMPALMAGVRIATVSTIALTTVGSIVGRGGLGNLIGAPRAGRPPPRAGCRRGRAGCPPGASARAAAGGRPGPGSSRRRSPCPPRARPPR